MAIAEDAATVLEQFIHDGTPEHPTNIMVGANTLQLPIYLRR